MERPSPKGACSNLDSPSFPAYALGMPPRSSLCCFRACTITTWRAGSRRLGFGLNHRRQFNFLYRGQKGRVELLLENYRDMHQFNDWAPGVTRNCIVRPGDNVVACLNRSNDAVPEAH